jgi:hypothetical protein
MSQRTVGFAALVSAVTFFAWLAVPSAAPAQQIRPAVDAEAAGAEAWFQQYIPAGSLVDQLSEQGDILTLPPEKPSEHPSLTKAKPWSLVEIAPLGVLTLDTVVPLQRGDWNDTLQQPAMFQLYFEPIPVTPPTAIQAPPASGA